MSKSTTFTIEPIIHDLDNLVFKYYHEIDAPADELERLEFAREVSRLFRMESNFHGLVEFSLEEKIKQLKKKKEVDDIEFNKACMEKNLEALGRKSNLALKFTLQKDPKDRLHVLIALLQEISFRTFNREILRRNLYRPNECIRDNNAFAYTVEEGYEFTSPLLKDKDLDLTGLVDIVKEDIKLGYYTLSDINSYIDGYSNIHVK